MGVNQRIRDAVEKHVPEIANIKFSSVADRVTVYTTFPYFQCELDEMVRKITGSLRHRGFKNVSITHRDMRRSRDALIINYSI